MSTNRERKKQQKKKEREEKNRQANHVNRSKVKNKDRNKTLSGGQSYYDQWGLRGLTS